MRCSQCQRDWPAEFRVCPICATPLPGDVAHAEKDSIATVGDGNISVGGSVLGSIYHIYQAPLGPRTLSEAGFKRILDDYLTWVWSECRYARLHGLQALAGQGPKRKPLAAIYTSLQVTHGPAVQPGGRRGRREELERLPGRDAAPRAVDMADLLTLGPRVAIVGGAGSGKTTYLAFVAASLADALGGAALDTRLKPPRPDRPLPIPFLAPLRFWNVYRRECRAVPGRRLEHPDEGSLAGFLLWYLRLSYRNFDAAGDFFDRLLRGGGALIMLDGLDEVVQREERLVVRDAISRLLDRPPYQGNQCLVTAREAGYRDAPFGDDFVRCDVQPMSEEQIAALVHAWCQGIPELERAEADVVRVIGELNAERRARGQEPLVSTPLMVTMIVSVRYSQRELPRERAKLYDACVDAILQAQYGADADAAGAREALITWGGPPDKQREWLSHLAFQMHRAGADGAVADEARVRAILAPALVERGETDQLEAFIGALRSRGGLFEERGEQFQFLHLTFQEYLAAQYLARQWGQCAPGEVARWVADPWWREALLLTVGSLDSPTPYEQRRAFIQLLLGLAGDAEAQLVAAELAGTGLLDLTRAEPGLLAAAHARLLELLTDDALLNQARPPVGGPTRARAADALARLPGGDTRPGVGLSPLLVGEGPGEGLPDLVWCLVPAGPFLMGSDRERDPQAWSAELPQHTFTIPEDYYIARYPVTNAQFGAFVAAADGYRNDRWWTKAGLAWRRDRSGPEKYGGVFDLPNHPVVGVSWYEAVAYCHWLTSRIQDTGYKMQVWRNGAIRNLPSAIRNRVVRLPSEAEWEKAARGGLPSPLQGEGPGVRVYPWGHEPDPNRANYGDTGLGTTSAVGCFPAGASPYGVLDMAGNVWEWCATKWQGNYQGYRDDNDPAGDAARVVRGGSFVYTSWDVRCACRNGVEPYLRGRLVGFRVVWASPIASGL